ncbi:hypothetical protein GGI07_000697 [Coemansia sp. Benny D115]|nr:hypothetical protein GGI07_000697 [Coemansia sp. Benny D115]
MSTSHSQGIHTLLEAEKEASKIVTQAREYRVKRLNNARTEATTDIEKIRARKNQELEEIQKKSVNQSEMSANIQKETDAQMAAIREQFEKNKQEAIAKLIEAVVTPSVGA